MAIPKDRQGIKIDPANDTHLVTHRHPSNSSVALNDNSSIGTPRLLSIDGRDEKAANDNGVVPIRPVSGRINPGRFYPTKLGLPANSNK